MITFLFSPLYSEVEATTEKYETSTEAYEATTKISE